MLKACRRAKRGQLSLFAEMGFVRDGDGVDGVDGKLVVYSGRWDWVFIGMGSIGIG
jgi:hypothetical protein